MTSLILFFVARHREPTGMASPCPLTRPLIHLHLSKTGGTELCAAAKKQGCRSHGINCARRINLQDGPWWVPWSDRLSPWHLNNFGYPPHVQKNRTCAFRREMRSLFFNVESPLFGLCEGFDYSVTLRAPLARATSMARELVRWGLLARERCGNYTEWRRVAPALFDNYYVRMLDGEATYLVTSGGIAKSHFERARAALERFTLVTTLENATRDFGAVFHLALSSHGGAASRRGRGGCELPPADALRFHADHRWDAELYALAMGRERSRWRPRTRTSAFDRKII